MWPNPYKRKNNYFIYNLFISKFRGKRKQNILSDISCTSIFISNSLLFFFSFFLLFHLVGKFQPISKIITQTAVSVSYFNFSATRYYFFNSSSWDGHDLIANITRINEATLTRFYFLGGNHVSLRRLSRLQSRFYQSFSLCSVMILQSPLLASEQRNSLPTRSKHAERRKVGEVAGGAAAECAAVWCCCPCAVVNLVVLAVYRVPAAVCKKAWRRSKRRRFMTTKRHGLLAEGSQSTVHARLKEEDPTAEIIVFEESAVNVNGELNDVMVLEGEMLERFYGTGFWRSLSKRNT